MQNFISVDGQKIDLTKEQMEKAVAALGIQIQRKTLAEAAVGETVKIGGFEMVVLEQNGTETSLILKGIYGKDTTFGENNNYVGSNADKRCQEFEKELAERVGEDNIVLHTVDLTANDGLKCYGTTERKVSCLTADRYRKFVDILDTVNPNKWWWLATPWSTARHDSETCVLCVAPSGNFFHFYIYYYGALGVRPFCILKSTIFVSG